MIIELDGHLIETDDITNITPVYSNGDESSFRVYMPISYVVVKGDDGEVTAKRALAERAWRGNGLTKQVIADEINIYLIESGVHEFSQKNIDELAVRISEAWYNER